MLDFENKAFSEVQDLKQNLFNRISQLFCSKVSVSYVSCVDPESGTPDLDSNLDLHESLLLGLCPKP